MCTSMPARACVGACARAHTLTPQVLPDASSLPPFTMRLRKMLPLLTIILEVFGENEFCENFGTKEFLCLLK